METQEFPADDLSRFLDADQRVKGWPRKLKDKVLVLGYLTTKFAPGRRYTEREVNEVLARWHTYGQPTQLRRELIDRRYLARTPDGREYWVVELDAAPGVRGPSS